MNINQISSLFDYERYYQEIPHMRREETLCLVRFVSLLNSRSTITYTRLNQALVEATIEQEIAYFKGLGHTFEWKVYSTDTPDDLVKRLAARGFEIEQPSDVVVVLETNNAPANLLQPVTLDIRRVTSPDQLEAIRQIHNEMSQGDEGWLIDYLSATFQSNPKDISLYVGYDNGQPVSCGWTFFSGKSQFAGLFGGSTLAAHRQKGFYTAMLATRLQEARLRGVSFLTVDAGPMSLQILEKRGFQRLCEATACQWRG